MNKYIDMLQFTNVQTVDDVLKVLQQIKQEYGGQSRITFDTINDSYILKGCSIQVFDGQPPYTEVTFDIETSIMCFS